MTHRSSFSQHNMFEQCKLSWYYKYVLGLEEEQDLSYAHGGNVVHKCLEEYYNGNMTDVDKLKEKFNKLWKYYGLDDSLISKKKDTYWLMVLNGKNLNLDCTSTELKIYFPFGVCYIDLVDTDKDILVDWKSSTRSNENEEQYRKQLMFYAWMFYMKFGRLPKELRVYYLKHPNKMILSVKPDMKSIDEIKRWYMNILDEMEYIKKNNQKPVGTCNFYFCPFKKVCEKNLNDTFDVELEIKDNFIYVKRNLPELLNKGLKKKFSYELKNAYWIKKNNRFARTTMMFWDERRKRLPLGFLQSLKKTLQDYAKYKNKKFELYVNDKRKFDDEIIDMPEGFLDGKELRDYQKKAVDNFMENKITMLELATGAGKSHILAEAIRRTGYKTLIVVNRREILNQLKGVIEKSLGVEVGVVSSGERNYKHITLGTIQTLRKLAPYDVHDVYNSFRMVIFDECHNINHNSYFNFSFYIPNTEYRLGLSGTTFRADGNDMFLTAVCGDINYRYNADDLIKDGWLMRPELYFIQDYMPTHKIYEYESECMKGNINETSDYHTVYNRFVVNNEFRNKVIENLVNKHKGSKILILVKMIEHGEYLSRILRCNYIKGDSSKKFRDKVMENFKNDDLNIMIGTQSIFSEGIDVPSLNILINACGHKSDVKTVQMLGRILRKQEGKERCIYYDFIDEHKMLRASSYFRYKTLKKQGHRMKRISLDGGTDVEKGKEK